MRVLHIIQELGVGGAERVVVALARGAREQGGAVAVAAADGTLAGELPGVERFALPVIGRRLTRVPAGVRAVDRTLRTWRPEIVHCHNPGTALLTGLATIRARRTSALCSVHGVPDDDYGASARVLRLAGLPTVACGPGVAEGLAEHGLDVAATIVNGVSAAPRPADRTSLDREWGLEPGRPLLLAVGRLVEAKNQALAVRALAGVPDASLVFVGDGPLREQLAQAARSAGVEERVVLAGPHLDARALIGAADALVISSRSEGLPLVALEALAAGTPVVATSVRGLRELLSDGRTALLVPPDDPEALAAALNRLLADDALARSLAERGLQLAGRYTEDAMVTAYLDLYATLA